MALRTAANNENVQCKGTLWLLQQLLEQQKITPQIARAATEKMKQSQSRLPWDEIEKIISAFE